MFRHAEKENSGTSNPPLSLGGLNQARKILEEMDLQQLPRPTKLFSSPKLRAQQTFQQVQDKLGVPLQIHPDLDERHNFESHALFSRRVQNYLLGLEYQPGVVYFVTHLDWIEESLRLIHSDTDLVQDRFQAWSPAQFIEFEVHDRLWIFHQMRSIHP
jgi:phosphohistidine phosphatase SixA